MIEFLVAIAGAIVGGICTYVVSILLRTRKIIEYDTSSMPLLRFTPASDHALTVSVDKSTLTGDSADKGVPIEVKSAYGFQIDLLNTGNEPIVQPNVEILLDKTAKIIEYETQPSSSSAYEVKVIKDKLTPNILNLTVPYINSGEHILVRLISTENENRQCGVKALGLGVKTRRRARNLPFLVGGMCSYTIFVSTFFILFFALQTGNPDWLLTPLGIIDIIAGVVSLIIVIVFLNRFLADRQRRLGISRTWDWKEPASSSKRSFLQRLLR